jgi:hypothetical protein
MMHKFQWEKFEDTKGVIRTSQSKDRQLTGQKKEQTTIYKALHIQLKIK